MIGRAASGRWTRRRVAGGAAAALALGATSGLRANSQPRPIFRMLCWPGYDDPDVTRGFRDATGFDIQADLIGSNDEIFLYLRAGGLGRYDLVTPANGVTIALADAGLTAPLDPARVPALASLFPRFQQPDWAISQDKLVAVPFVWGTSPLIYNKATLAVPPLDWPSLLDDAYRGRIIMTDDALSNIFIWNHALGAEDPARVSGQALAATTDQLVRLKRLNAIAFTGDMHEVVNHLVAGPAWLAIAGADGLPFYQAAAGQQLAAARPVPGDCSFVHTLAIPARAPHTDAAYALIDHLLQPATQALLLGRIRRATVRPDAVPLLDPGTRSLVGYDDLDAFFATSPLLDYPPLGRTPEGHATYIDWVNAWTRVRSTSMTANADRLPTPEADRPPASDGTGGVDSGNTPSRSSTPGNLRPQAREDPS